MSRITIRRTMAIGATALASAMLAGPAFAAHDHYILTPNGMCHQVAEGQTSIADPDHGGYHQFHDHVHVGASGDAGTPGDDYLGHGNAAVAVYKAGPAPAVCDGD